GNSSVATRATPIARARSITRASLPALQTRVVGCPARSSSALMHAAQYASDDHPRHDMRWSALTAGPRSANPSQAAAPGQELPVDRLHLRRVPLGAVSLDGP